MTEEIFDDPPRNANPAVNPTKNPPKGPLASLDSDEVIFGGALTATAPSGSNLRFHISS